MTQFCPCGRILDSKYNRHYDRAVEGYCNAECERKIKTKKPRPRRKYGIGGQVYDNYHEGDVFKWHKEKK